ncbi:MauE/DoxX family redox-associated membrane protein [Micromonospora sp. CA-249363]|uniref:MauE/DoxX family redox-associated membrane protein n=1 Tax=Micromonospora sp. CA-249363 TaxID=3239963 RepID=UPI003D91C0E4
MTYLALACRVLVGVTFLAALVGKVRSRAALRAFLTSLETLRWLPAWLRPVAATATLVAELTIVGLVAWSPTAGAGLALAAVAVVVFTAAMVDARRRGARVACRCFGGTAEVWGRAQLVRNVLLAGTAALGVLATMSSGAQPPLAGVCVTAAGALVAALLLIHSQDVGYLLGLDRS